MIQWLPRENRVEMAMDTPDLSFAADRYSPPLLIVAAHAMMDSARTTFTKGRELDVSRGKAARGRHGMGSSKYGSTFVNGPDPDGRGEPRSHLLVDSLHS
jgi:hypothetical protein